VSYDAKQRVEIGPVDQSGEFVAIDHTSGHG
jgi:hypothetical protein